MRVLLLLATFLGACECGASPREGTAEERVEGPEAAIAAEGLVLVWEVESARWGRELFMLKEDGRARFLQEPGGLRGEQTLTSGELAQLRADLTSADVCAVRSRREGEPDESRPTLTLAMDGLRCERRLWWGEWRETAAWPVLERWRRQLQTVAASQPRAAERASPAPAPSAPAPSAPAPSAAGAEGAPSTGASAEAPG
ncbi:MAG: hypothetical protein AAGH15_25680, partial [Myxococcota bacterium]